MEALRAMASGKPLDSQREERWPNQTQVLFGQQKGVKGWLAFVAAGYKN